MASTTTSETPPTVPAPRTATKGGSVPGRSRKLVAPPDGAPDSGFDALQEESVDYFVSFVQLFGLPRSIGQIYGLLFVSTEPLAMDDIVERLRISKGSASQGLSLLRELGAVTSRHVEGDRRDHYEADLNVSRIVTHFFENRVQERLAHADERIGRLLHLARATDRNWPEDRETRLARIQALQKWQKRGKRILPLIVGWLRPRSGR